MKKRKLESSRKIISLSDCLTLFHTQERLGPEDPWFCPSCKKHQQAWKKFDLWKLPEILVVHLKRFQYTRFHRDKLTFQVDFPTENFDLSPWILNPDEKNTQYELFAISNHMGGLGGGHYTAFAKNKIDELWHSFNDTHVDLVKDTSTIKTSSAYVLFYKKQKNKRIS